MSKHCSLCNKTLNYSDFGKDKTRKDGLCYYCKACTSRRQYEWRRRNPDRRRVLERKSYLKKRWGMTSEEYDAQLASQDGMCAICLRPETEPNKRLAIDHNHETGAIRGLLCRKCNTSLAQFENTGSLHRALKYVNNEIKQSNINHS